MSKTVLPIQNGLLEIMLYETERKYDQQIYLELLWKALFMIGHYGLMRVGELTQGTHTVRAKNIFVNKERQKLKLYLYSSKTHGKQHRPQTIKIEGNVHLAKTETKANQRRFDPYTITYDYLNIRGDYTDENEQLFIFRDGTPVKPSHMRKVMREILSGVNLDPLMYDTHSLRIGRATDMLKYGYDIEQIKQLGRWRSNAIYQYLKFL